MTERFSVVAHTAETALHIEAVSYEGLLRQAALGLLALSGADGVTGPDGFIVPVELKADSPEELLVDWMNTVISMIFKDGRLPTGFSFSAADGSRILARLRGPTMPSCCGLRELKAATYHGLKIVKITGVYSATVIVDV